MEWTAINNESRRGAGAQSSGLGPARGGPAADSSVNAAVQARSKAGSASYGASVRNSRDRSDASNDSSSSTDLKQAAAVDSSDGAGVELEIYDKARDDWNDEPSRENLERLEHQFVKFYGRILKLHQQYNRSKDNAAWAMAREGYVSLLEHPLRATRHSHGAKHVAERIAFLSLRNLAELEEAAATSENDPGVGAGSVLALQYLLEAVQIDDTDFSTWLRMGALCLKLGKVLLARHAYEQAIRLSRSNWAAAQGLVTSLGRLREDAGGILSHVAAQVSSELDKEERKGYLHVLSGLYTSALAEPPEAAHSAGAAATKPPAIVTVHLDSATWHELAARLVEVIVDHRQLVGKVRFHVASSAAVASSADASLESGAKEAPADIASRNNDPRSEPMDSGDNEAKEAAPGSQAAHSDALPPGPASEASISAQTSVAKPKVRRKSSAAAAVTETDDSDKLNAASSKRRSKRVENLVKEADISAKSVAEVEGKGHVVYRSAVRVSSRIERLARSGGSAPPVGAPAIERHG